MDIFTPRERAILQAKMEGFSQPAKSKRYGKPSVMDSSRKIKQSNDEIDFRQRGGIEMLANRARGIETDNASKPFTNRALQASALEYKKTFDDDTRKRINQDIGNEVSRAKNPGLHMGTPSEANKRLPSSDWLKSSSFKKKLMKASKNR